MKKIIVAMLVIVLMTGCATDKAMQEREIVESEKYVGSKYLPIDKIENVTLEWLVEKAELIIVGIVKDNGEYFIKEVKPDQETLQRKLDGNYPKFSLTKNIIEIKEVIYGEADGTTIEYVQMGKPNDDYGQTKVMMDDEVLLLLHKNEEDGYYASVAFEDAQFKIIEGKVISMTNNKNIIKYDNKEKEDIIKEIKVNIKNKK